MLMQEHGNAIFVYILYIFLYRIPRVTTFQEFRNIRLGSTKANYHDMFFMCLIIQLYLDNGDIIEIYGDEICSLM